MSSQTPEGKVKVWIDKVMKDNFPNAFRYRPPGVGRFGRNGMPDLTYLIKANDYCSIYIAIEAKVPGNVPTGLQMKTLKELQSQGAVAAVVTGKDTAKMGRIISEVNRRLLLANEKPGTSSVPASEGDNRISTEQQKSLRIVRIGDWQDLMSAMGDGYIIMLRSSPEDVDYITLVNPKSSMGIRIIQEFSSP